MEVDECRILCAAKSHTDLAATHHQIDMMTIDCTFFHTESGRMGTASSSGREGDVIVSSPGVKTPMILRQREQPEKHN